MRSGAADAARPGLVLDAGALLAIAHGKLTDVLMQAHVLRLPTRLSGGALAQAWRGGPRSARLGALLKKELVSVIALDDTEARHVGELLARLGWKRRAKPDVVDAHTALLALVTKSLVYTSDASDLAGYGVPEAMIRRV